ncbi:MAG: hypothetical protein K8T90_13500 [Planctomycetes bacterium]|nr:hypothetical protein [Planctomycetota bacterium]
MDLVLPLPSATTGEAGKGGDQAPSGAASDNELRRLLLVSEWDPRPVLLYFHYAHDEDLKAVSSEGRVSKKQCDTVNEETVARWCLLFRCYEVDMSKSDRASAERLGAGTGTSYSIVRGNLEVIAKSGPVKDSKVLAKFMEDALHKGCTDWWASIEKRLEEQKKLIEEARALAAKKDWKAAKVRYDEIRSSELRITPEWEAASTEADKVDEKAKQAK